MKRFFRHCARGTFLLWGLAACAASPQIPVRIHEAEPEPTPKELRALVGVREFEDPAWEPLESQVNLGLDYGERIEDTILWLEGGLRSSYDRTTVTVMGERVGLDAQTFEATAGLGLPVDFESLRLRAYVGAGASLLFADLERRDGSSDDYDTVFGGYAKAGLLFRISNSTFIGVELRRFEGDELQFDDFDAEPDSDQVAVVFGTFL